MDAGKTKIVGSITKSNTEQINVSIRLYNNNLYVDIRVWQATLDGIAPTKKGVQFPVSSLNQLVDLLQTVQSMVKDINGEPDIVTKDEIEKVVADFEKGK